MPDLGAVAWFLRTVGAAAGEPEAGKEAAMPEYEHSQTIQAPPEAVFAFVSQVQNLPQYLPTIKAAEPQGPERVQVHGEARGHQYDNDGHFRADEARRRLEWGSDRPDTYSGWLTVADADGAGGASQVTVHLTFGPQSRTPENIEQEEGSQRPIQEGLEAALLSIQNIVEGQGGKVEPPAAT